MDDPLEEVIEYWYHFCFYMYFFFFVLFCWEGNSQLVIHYVYHYPCFEVLLLCSECSPGGYSVELYVMTEFWRVCMMESNIVMHFCHDCASVMV